jgi:hypothetical protein
MWSTASNKEHSMTSNTRQPRRGADLGSNTAPDAISDDLRRRDQRRTPPDSLPPRGERTGDIPAGGGFTPAEDGGVEQHPVHDSDQEDATPSDYERAIDRPAE